MKKIFLLIALLITTIACAADVKLEWDPMPPGQQWTAVRIYEHVGANFTQVGEVAMSSVTITIPNVPTGPHAYVARSVAPIFVGSTQLEESVNSNEVTCIILAKPESPTTLRIKIP